MPLGIQVKGSYLSVAARPCSNSKLLVLQNSNNSFPLLNMFKKDTCEIIVALLRKTFAWSWSYVEPIHSVADHHLNVVAVYCYQGKFLRNMYNSWSLRYLLVQLLKLSVYNNENLCHRWWFCTLLPFSISPTSHPVGIWSMHTIVRWNAH